MRVIIANNGTNITYEKVTNISDEGKELILFGSDEEYICITLNGWLIAKVISCVVEKRCLCCVDEVFLDTREDGV